MQHKIEDIEKNPINKIRYKFRPKSKSVSEAKRAKFLQKIAKPLEMWKKAKNSDFFEKSKRSEIRLSDKNAKRNSL